MKCKWCGRETPVLIGNGLCPGCDHVAQDVKEDAEFIRRQAWEAKD